MSLVPWSNDGLVFGISQSSSASLVDNHAYPIVWRPLVNESSIFATTYGKVDDVVNNTRISQTSGERKWNDSLEM